MLFYQKLIMLVKQVEDATEAVEAATQYATSVTKEENEYELGINTVLDNYFYRATNFYYDHHDIDIKKMVLEYYKKYLELTVYRPTSVKKYMNALANNLDDKSTQKEYFEMFEIYFNKIMLPNKSTIENLDASFMENIGEEDNWTTYKNYFAIDCNQAAWEIVKKVSDKNWIQKAIKWSKTSIEIEKSIHYYWDTLARLYYLNGQKEKAIATQQKAIDLGESSENKEDYQMTLEQMKNGTYTLLKE